MNDDLLIVAGDLLIVVMVGLFVIASWIGGYIQGYNHRDEKANKEKEEIRRKYLSIKERYK